MNEEPSEESKEPEVHKIGSQQQLLESLVHGIVYGDTEFSQNIVDELGKWTKKRRKG